MQYLGIIEIEDFKTDVKWNFYMGGDDLIVECEPRKENLQEIKLGREEAIKLAKDIIEYYDR